MNRFVRSLIALGVLVGGVALAYELLLTDEAKAEVRRAARTIRNSYEKISEVVSSMTGEVMDDGGPLPNVQATNQQWERLGY
jgi:hypothetical protein